jgi:hypothetical protein
MEPQPDNVAVVGLPGSTTPKFQHPILTRPIRNPSLSHAVVEPYEFCYHPVAYPGPSLFTSLRILESPLSKLQRHNGRHSRSPRTSAKCFPSSQGPANPAKPDVSRLHPASLAIFHHLKYAVYI